MNGKNKGWKGDLAHYQNNYMGENVCPFRSPCGFTCCLHPDINHELHCCNRTNCKHCHGAERFQRRG